MGIRRVGQAGPVDDFTGTVTIDLPSAGSAAVTIATIAVAEAQAGDMVLFAPPVGGLSVAVALGVGWCETNGSCRVPIINPTAGALDAASASLRYCIIRP